jgi:hypothetical protein
MATQTKTDPAEAFETATQQVSENRRQVHRQRQEGGRHLSRGLERLTLAALNSYEKAAASTRIEWLVNLTGAQAGYARELTKVQVAAARDLVAA